MYIKTKFKMGDSVYGFRNGDKCRVCSRIDNKSNRVDFTVEKMAIYLNDYGNPEINYCDSYGLAGWFEESELKKAKEVKKQMDKLHYDTTPNALKPILLGAIWLARQVCWLFVQADKWLFGREWLIKYGNRGYECDVLDCDCHIGHVDESGVL
jgi:hypothetical protein